MATMISEVYDAFRSVGVPEDTARAAAEALCAQLAAKADLARLEHATTVEVPKLGRDAIAASAIVDQSKPAFDKLRKDLVVMKWMLTLVLVAVAIPLLKPYFG